MTQWRSYLVWWKELQVKKLSFEVDLRHFSLVSGVGICSTSCAENRNHHHEANLKWIEYCFRQSFATLEMSRRLEPKCVPQLFLGLLLDAPVSLWVFSHDVTEAILVSQNNETTAMLVSQTSPLGFELFSYANAFFSYNKFADMLTTWVKTLYWQFFPLSPVTVPGFCENVSWAKLPSRF